MGIKGDQDHLDFGRGLFVMFLHDNHPIIVRNFRRIIRNKGVKKYCRSSK